MLPGRMADSRAYNKAEDWIRKEWMPEKFGMRFSRERLALSSGGNFEFDAVSHDENVAALISCSSGITKSGRAALPKLNKIRSDCLFLLMAALERRVLLFSDEALFQLVSGEKKSGRFPQNIELYHAPLPTEFRDALATARQAAIDEER